MSIRGFLYFGGHGALLDVQPDVIYGGERRLYDIGEEDCVGVVRTNGGDRQIHPINWYSHTPRIKRALAACRGKTEEGQEHSKVNRPRPVLEA